MSHAPADFYMPGQPTMVETEISSLSSSRASAGFSSFLRSRWNGCVDAEMLADDEEDDDDDDAASVPTASFLTAAHAVFEDPVPASRVDSGLQTPFASFSLTQPCGAAPSVRVGAQRTLAEIEADVDATRARLNSSPSGHPSRPSSEHWTKAAAARRLKDLAYHHKTLDRLPSPGAQAWYLFGIEAAMRTEKEGCWDLDDYAAYCALVSSRPELVDALKELKAGRREQGLEWISAHDLGKEMWRAWITEAPEDDEVIVERQRGLFPHAMYGASWVFGEKRVGDGRQLLGFEEREEVGPRGEGKYEVEVEEEEVEPRGVKRAREEDEEDVELSRVKREREEE